jgi:drug/metabolite transporter superfamily protein YnfA
LREIGLPIRAMTTLLSSKPAQLAVLVLAALFEVGGDALIRAGLRGKGLLFIVIGFCILGSYGLVLNQVAIDFSKLLGVYVGLFALVSILFGKFLFSESIAPSTWLGLGVVLLGSLIIQWG